MPKVWLTWEDKYKEWTMWDYNPVQFQTDIQDVVSVEMNGSLYRQIRAAEKKYEKFQELLEKFYAEGVEHPGTTRRVR